ncbi:MAG: DUF2752 domain-containing protein [Clostridia bacterium]|nr:DUF2752 domain-containing protein [Clostridia bacterium]
MNKKSFLVVIILLIVLVIYGCPIYKWLGIPCPACGTTRAWITFIKGDIISAIKYNAFFMFFPLLIIFFYSPQKNKFLSYVVYALVFIIFIYNIFRWLGFFVIQPK